MGRNSGVDAGTCVEATATASRVSTVPTASTSTRSTLSLHLLLGESDPQETGAPQLALLRPLRRDAAGRAGAGDHRRATFAYLCDVCGDSRAGAGNWLMECVMAHPDLQGLRRFSLVTRDAHELYRPFGFTEIEPRRQWRSRARGSTKQVGCLLLPLHLQLDADLLRRQDAGQQQELAGLGDGDRQRLDAADQAFPEDPPSPRRRRNRSRRERSRRRPCR